MKAVSWEEEDPGPKVRDRFHVPTDQESEIRRIKQREEARKKWRERIMANFMEATKGPPTYSQSALDSDARWACQSCGFERNPLAEEKCFMCG